MSISDTQDQGLTSVSIVVPTFREAANIPALAERIQAAMKENDLQWELVLADDDSDDGSDQVVRELAKQMPVRLESRKAKYRDLSLSVLFGIKQAKFNRIVVMDADLSHPPECIVQLLRALDGECGMAIGSRYVPSGDIDESWSLWRLLNSQMATLLAKPLVSCSDPMSGFFAIERESLPDLDSLQPLGFKIGLELMVRGQLSVREVPIHFQDRDLGKSKMGFRQQLEYLRHLHRLYAFRYGWPVQFFSFLLVGASGFIIDLAFYLGLQAAGMGHHLARLLSFWPAVTWNWLLNRWTTFSERMPDACAGQWVKFVTSSIVGLVVNVGSYFVLTSYVNFFDQYRVLALALGVVLGSVFNYLLSSQYVYRKGPVAEASDSQ